RLPGSTLFPYTTRFRSDYEKAAEGIAHAWRVHSVRVVDVRPGFVTLWATMRDPLTEVTVSPAPVELLRVRPGKLENGRDWVIDLDRKSTRLNSSHVKIS